MLYRPPFRQSFAAFRALLLPFRWCSPSPRLLPGRRRFAVRLYLLGMRRTVLLLVSLLPDWYVIPLWPLVSDAVRLGVLRGPGLSAGHLGLVPVGVVCIRSRFVG